MPLNSDDSGAQIMQVLASMPAVVREFAETLEKCSSGEDLPKEMPLWAQKVHAELYRSMFPTLTPQALKTFSPEDQGRFLGHLLSLLSFAKSEFAPERHPNPSPVLASCIAMISVMEQLVQAELSRRSSTAVEELPAFFSGMSDAIKKTVDSSTRFLRSRESFFVYFVMALLWRDLAKLHCIRELHARLVELLGANLAGNEERIKKTCQRLGLRFTSRGRPRKK